MILLLRDWPAFDHAGRDCHQSIGKRLAFLEFRNAPFALRRKDPSLRSI
jgi:hypothetical protein